MYTPDPSLATQVAGVAGTFAGSAAKAAGWAKGGLMEEPDTGYRRGGIINASDMEMLAGLGGSIVGSFLGEGEED